MLLDGAEEDGFEFLEVERFGEKIVGTTAHGFDGSFDITVGRHHDADRARVGWQGECLVDDAEAGFPCHAQVGENEVEALVVKEADGFVGVACEEDVIVHLQGGV